jgi:hypothetical protein
MTVILTIKASTTTDEIESAIPYLDMRQEAIERRDDALAVLAEQGDNTVLELHDEGDDISVLYSPTFDYAYVNQKSPGIGNSLLIESGEAGSPEHAASVWRDGNA